MQWIIVLLILMGISMFCVKIGSVALRMTGMDQDTASFQSLSAFSGTGFTTREAEAITKDRRRRKIAKALMVAGNAGLAVAIAAIIHVFGNTTFAWETFLRVTVLILGVLLLYLAAVGAWINNWLSRFIEKRLESVTDLAMPHFEHILHLSKGYGISELRIRDEHPAAGKSLQDLGWTSRGVLVLAIERGRELISSPRADTVIEDGDEIVCYGPVERVREIAASRKVTPSNVDGKDGKPKGGVESPPSS